ncbi:sugar O-acetyltransferase [Clostridiales bacterium COT073_COT-073]|nr:sugar O-acetyltransferase [Clostridiales bacterium COT073_COT-073]
MTQKERMIAGLPYLAADKELVADRKHAKEVWYQFNQLSPNEFAAGQAMLRQLFGKAGKGMYIEPTFRCDYGYNIYIGDNFYSNYNLIILDIAPVTIGNNVMIAPNVGIYTAGHPIHPAARQSGYEYGAPITIGDGVWIGAHSVLNPGVNIGENTVIGAGSVVTKDIPANCVAAGNPCQVIRQITDQDKKYYFKDKLFDLDWE